MWHLNPLQVLFAVFITQLQYSANPHTASWKDILNNTGTGAQNTKATIANLQFY
jgi:hypothetical protein